MNIQDEINRLDNTVEITLWTNAKGESCVREWTAMDLMTAFRYAESKGDDLLYCAVMNEVERRRLKIEE